MAMSNNIYTYTDVHQVLAAADKYGGGRFISTSKNAANYWRMRANKYRALLKEKHGVCTFDAYIFRADPLDPCTTLIELNRPQGKFLAPDGTEITPELSTPADLINPSGSGYVTPDGEAKETSEAGKLAEDLAERLRRGEFPL